MYQIIDYKNTGKTSRLLLLAKEHNGLIVCANPERLREKALFFGIVGIDFVSYEEYFHNDFSTRMIFIDDISAFLNHFDINIKGFTATKEPIV